MSTEDAYSSGHLVLSHFETCIILCSNVETKLSWTGLVSGLLSFEHPSVLLFCLVCTIFVAFTLFKGLFRHHTCISVFLNFVLWYWFYFCFNIYFSNELKLSCCVSYRRTCIINIKFIGPAAISSILKTAWPEIIFIPLALFAYRNIII